MPEVTLRLVHADDLDWLDDLEEAAQEEAGFEAFGFRGRGRYAKRFANDGCQGDADGVFVVCADGNRVGTVSYHALQQGPSAACRAYNIGIGLAAAHRGQGIGGLAQRQLADRLFATTLVNRCEAGTDAANLAEQRALLKAGFTREGVLRGAQFRAGAWQDVVLFSRLRSDP
ncbi:MAG: GNAT family N-acetyltransferase [Mycobacteriales bacterium]